MSENGRTGGRGDRVLGWLDRRRNNTALRFAEDSGGWRLVPYDELAAATEATAMNLREHGVGRGDVVSIVVPTSPGFVTSFYGAIRAGGTASPLVPPGYLQGDYVSHIAAAMRVARPRAVVTVPEIREVVASAVEHASLGGSVPILSPSEPGSAKNDDAPAAPVSLLQFTSGSSGRPRGVRVGREQLASQIAMLDRWLEITDTDALAAWLPLYHDMGLIGLLTAMDARGDAWLLRPEQFILDPMRWLQALSEGRGTITATPNFGFSFAQKRLADADLSGLDLQRLKAVIVGAERLDPAVFARFVDWLGPHGFSPEAFAPAYGLAEATLAVCGLGLAEAPQALRVEWSQLDFGEPVVVHEQAEVASRSVGDGRGWIMGCGRPLGATQVAILDEDGGEVPEGSFGEIHVRGPSVALGYLSETSGPSDFDEDGALATGDAGFLLGGQLYVVGRIGEALKVRGRNVYAEDLESKLCSIPGVPQGRCVAIAASEEGLDAVTILLETEPGPWVEEARGLLRHELGPGVAVRLLQVPRSSIERTSSGKPRRRATWQRLRDGDLSFEAIAEWGGPEVPEPA